MAKIDTAGLDALILDMDEIVALDEETAKEMLDAGGEVIRKAHIAALKKTFNQRSGRLAASPEIHLKVNGSDRYALIYPSGTHHTYKAVSKTYTKQNWGRSGTTVKTKGGEKKATNQDVAFVHEYGGHGNDATQWMRKANEEHAAEAVEAEFAVFDAWHKKHNL